MAALSDYLEDELLDHILNNAAFTSPTSVYISLHTGSPLDDDSGANEVSGGSYARVTKTAGFTVAGGGAGTASNTTAVSFPTATANWGTVTHVGIYDAATVGNLLAHGALDTSRTVNSGGTVEFGAGDLVMSLA